MTIMETSPVYYRLLWSDREKRAVVVCMQDFDEYDYDQLKFLNTEKYPTEEEAETALFLISAHRALVAEIADRIVVRDVEILIRLANS